MLRLYKKSELAFAIVGIVVYSLLQSVGMDLSRAAGVEYLGQAVVNAVLVGVLWVFMAKNGLLKRYGFCGAAAPASRFLWYLPLVLLMSQNLWFGVAASYSVPAAVSRLVCMLGVGFLEEVLFRGMLFRGIARDNVREAVVISSITFGIGHIINLVNGSGMGLVENLCQIAGAIAIGYLFVTVFYRGGTIIPCIVGHAGINMLSTFASDSLYSNQAQLISAIAVIVIAAAYAAVLTRTLPKPDDAAFRG